MLRCETRQADGRPARTGDRIGRRRPTAGAQADSREASESRPMTTELPVISLTARATVDLGVEQEAVDASRAATGVDGTSPAGAVWLPAAGDGRWGLVDFAN